MARLGRLKPRALYLGIGYTMLACAPLALLIASWNWFSLKRSFSQNLLAEHCLTIEGSIENFRPLIPTGYQESFTVATHYFFYSDQNSFIANPCFHQTNLRNGPIREGLRVRIKFSGNCILQIQELAEGALTGITLK